jgi:hypothetical protein
MRGRTAIEDAMSRTALFAILAALPLGLGTSIQAAAHTTKDLVGTWEWISVENTTPDGVTTQPFGPKPGGYLMFDQSGRFVWLITRPGRPNFASGKRDQGTPEENKATVHGSLAYCGTYAVSGDTLILKIEAGTYPNEEGAQQRRSFALSGDELSWRNPAVSTGASGVARLRRIY